MFYYCLLSCLTTERERDRDKKKMDPIVRTEEILNFIRHPRHSSVSYSPDDDCFLVNNRGKCSRIRGIHRLLSTHLWPDYDHREVMQLARPARPAHLRRRSAVGKPWSQRHLYMTPKGKQRELKGQARGSKVHEELCTYARMFHVDRSEFKRQHAAPHRYTIKIIVALERWGLTPYYGEFNIYDEYVGYATAIDMVCTDTNGDVVLVEVKTGFNGCFQQGTKPMEGPLGTFLSNAPVNQALLQAMLMENTVRKRYNIRSASGVVIHVDDSGVKMWTPKGKLLRQSANIYKWLAIKENQRKEIPRRRRGGGRNKP